MSTAPSDRAVAAYDVARDPPRLPDPRREIHGKPLVYLDNAATDAEAAGRHRRRARRLRALTTPTSTAACTGSRQHATDAYEAARETGRARSSTPPRAHEIIFVRGTTEAINLVAQTLRPHATSARATRS